MKFYDFIMELEQIDRAWKSFEFERIYYNYN